LPLPVELARPSRAVALGEVGLDGPVDPT
jgi:hypothetical protein